MQGNFKFKVQTLKFGTRHYNHHKNQLDRNVWTLVMVEMRTASG